MRSILLFIFLSFIGHSVAAQGNYFPSKGNRTANSYLDPWRYDLLEKDTTDHSMGRIIFWRSVAVHGVDSKGYWTPNISFRIYSIDDTTHFIAAQKKILNGPCSDGNKGGMIRVAGRFVFLNTDECVECANTANANYCEQVLNTVFTAINDPAATTVMELLRGIPIFRAKAAKTLRRK